jgi:hypothetical protein
MGEDRRGSRGASRLERQTALPLPRMGLGLLVGVGLCLLVFASADGLLWKYSEEREVLRAKLVQTETEFEALAEELRSLRRENAALREFHLELVAPEPFGAAGERGGLPPCQR